MDIDGMLAGEVRPLEDRHSAAASAAITAARLFGGVCINMARIAAALEDIADNTERLQPAEKPDIEDGSHGTSAPTVA